MSTERVLVGRVVRPHGLRGSVVVELSTDRPEDRFRPGAAVETEDGSRLTVESYEATDRSPLLTFREIEGRDQAEGVRGTHLYVPLEERRSLDEGEFWPDELAGMEVYHADGRRLGRVLEIETGVGQDRLVVEAEGELVIVPFVEELVPAVDVEARRLTVRLPPGLLD